MFDNKYMFKDQLHMWDFPHIPTDTMFVFFESISMQNLKLLQLKQL